MFFSYLIECSFFNAYILLSFVKTSLSVHEGSYLTQENCPSESVDLCVFIYAANWSPPSVANGNLERLNLSLGHFPQHSYAKARCVECNRMRHESWSECKQ